MANGGDFLARLEKCEQQLSKFPEPLKGKRFLDIGTGSGQTLIAAAKQGAASCFGFDPYPFLDGNADAIAEFDSTVRALGIDRERITVRNCGIEAAQDLDGQFDAIMIYDVLEHVTDPVLALRRAFELAAPGGLCVASTAPLYYSRFGHHLWGQLNEGGAWAHLLPGWHETLMRVSPKKARHYHELNRVTESTLYLGAMSAGWTLVSRKQTRSGAEHLEQLRRRAPQLSASDDCLTIEQSRLVLRKP
jgi:2-polyprenyl-3-methyl-5-hydroxy-6-metoxy-1,4-benzoquinol methylase